MLQQRQSYDSRQRRHTNLSSRFVIQVGFTRGEVGVRGMTHSQVEITRFAAIDAGFALTWHADAAAIGGSGRDTHFKGVGVHCARLTVHRL